MERQGQRLPNPKKMRKEIVEQYKSAKGKLNEALKDAKNLVKKMGYGDYGTNVTAVVNLAIVLFQLELSKEQGLHKAKQIEEALKVQKEALKRAQSQKRNRAKEAFEKGAAPFIH